MLAVPELRLYALFEEEKEDKKSLRKTASNLEEMHETLKQIAVALGCPLPKKETGKKPSKKQSKKQKNDGYFWQKTMPPACAHNANPLQVVPFFL